MRVRFVEEPEYTSIISKIIGPAQQLEHIWGFSFQAKWVVPFDTNSAEGNGFFVSTGLVSRTNDAEVFLTVAGYYVETV